MTPHLQKAHLSRLVRHYLENYQDGAEAQLDWFRNQPSLRTAIKAAGQATDDRGKRYSHQTCLSRFTLQKATSQLLASERQLRSARAFHELFLAVDAAIGHLPGIGELMVYDTAVRLGAYLGLYPKKVYLHAGARTGARALGFDGSRHWLELDELPSPANKLQPHQAEDWLCIYKRAFRSPAAAAAACARRLPPR